MHHFIPATEQLFLDPYTLMVFIAGLFGGLIFAAIPGIGMLTLGAIVLPFTAGMRAEDAILFYGVIYVTGTFGGAITAILFNIPGAPENAPTIFDGYPMTKKGQAGKAVGAAVTCSAIGGLSSALLMMGATGPLARWAVTSFGSAQIFALVFFGLSVSASVGAKSLWKGWLSVLLGLLISTIGIDPVAGLPRFTFGSTYLLAGVEFIPAVLGFFALAEVLVQVTERVQNMQQMHKVNMDFPTFREFWKLKIAIGRSMLIGWFCGLLPGIGATLAAFMGYNEAVRWSRHPERFGKGEIAGVVSSETANNAATGAAIIPLLALGLPGGALTAIMVGVFEMHGIDPGPLVLRNGANLVWLLFVGMFFANLSILFLGWLETKTVVHLLRIPFRFLAPGIILLAVIGAYARRGLVLDVDVLLITGIAGYFLRRTGYSMPGLVLGLVLGKIGERNFAQAMQTCNYNWVTFLSDPITAGLVGVGIVTIAWNLYKEILRHRRHDSQGPNIAIGFAEESDA